MSLDLSHVLNRLNLPQADWVGLRYLKKQSTMRFVRDGKTPNEYSFSE